MAGPRPTSPQRTYSATSTTDRQAGAVLQTNSPKIASALVSLSIVLGRRTVGSDLEIGEQGAADLGCGYRGETCLSGGGAAFASVVCGKVDHVGLEQQAAQMEQLASPITSHRFGQSR